MKTWPGAAWLLPSFCVFLVSGCSSAPSADESEPPETASPLSSASRSSASSSPDVTAAAVHEVEEDLVAPPLSLRLGDVIYEGAGAADAGDRAAQVGKIERLVPDNIEKTGYDWLEGGDSNHLERGTPVYAVEGYDPSFRVVARGDGGWTLYEVAANRGAEKAADLLDTGGEAGLVPVGDVASSPGPGTDGLRRPEEVTAFVDAVLGAPLVRITADYSCVRILTFGLEDGTESSRFYEPESGALYLGEEAPFSGVVLPEGLREDLRQTR